MEATITGAIHRALEELGLTEAVSFVVEHPADLTHGDYATNVALVASKPLKQPPRAVAEAIVAVLTGTIPEVADITIAGPGFINFTLERSFFTDSVAAVVGDPGAVGRHDTWAGKRVLVEYTDPNPFKEFHIGHLFTNAVGESLARIAMLAGADVKRLCYQGDVGLHVAHAIWGMQQLGITAERGFTAKDLGRAYAHGATAYKNDEAAKVAITALNKVIYERSDEAVNALYDAGRAVSLQYFETIYATVGTKFDAYFFESEAAPEGKRLVLAHPEVFTESDGAYVFVGEDYGLHTRVFLNKLGLPTYEAKELALAKLKHDHFGGYDHSIISTAKEINEYFKVLLKAMSFVYPELAEKTEHIGHGMVRLTTGKMSSRTGDVVPALEFIAGVGEEVSAKMRGAGVTEPTPELVTTIAVGAIKYATLKSNIRQDSVFDPERSLSFEGDSGPYLQYTHARIASLLEKAATVGVTPNTAHVPEVLYPVERLVYRFPEVTRAALHERAPHLIATYLTELAGAFNSFYATEKIAAPDDVYAPYKAAVAASVKATLQNGLFALGITAPERM